MEIKFSQLVYIQSLNIATSLYINSTMRCAVSCVTVWGTDVLPVKQSVQHWTWDCMEESK